MGLETPLLIQSCADAVYNNAKLLFKRIILSIDHDTECFIYYHKYILQIPQPSQYGCTQLQYRFAVISEAPSNITTMAYALADTNIHLYMQYVHIIVNVRQGRFVSGMWSFFKSLKPPQDIIYLFIDVVKSLKDIYRPD